MKYLKMFSLLAVLFFAGSAYAAEGDSNFTNVVTSGDVTVGDDLTVTDDVTVTGDVTSTGAVTFQTSIVSRGGVAASTVLQSSSTVLGPSSLPFSLVLKNVGGGTAGPDTQDGGTRLVNGTAGKTLTFLITSLGGSSYWDLTPDTSSGFTVLRFDTQGDMATLAYINDTLGWILISNGGTVVTTRKWGTGVNPSGF